MNYFKAALACLVLVVGFGCGTEEPGCVASPLFEAGYSEKSDFTGTWSHVAYLGAVEGDLELEVGAETPAQHLSWMVTEDLLLAEVEFAEQSQLGFQIASHATLGLTRVDTVCRVESDDEWFERDHFRIDWSQDLIAAETSIPGASAVDTSEWLVEPVSNFVESGIGLLEMEFVYDSEGRLESFFLPLKYSVRPCDECEPSDVNVFHRFERLD